MLDNTGIQEWLLPYEEMILLTLISLKRNVRHLKGIFHLFLVAFSLPSEKMVALKTVV